MIWVVVGHHCVMVWNRFLYSQSTIFYIVYKRTGFFFRRHRQHFFTICVLKTFPNISIQVSSWCPFFNFCPQPVRKAHCISTFMFFYKTFEYLFDLFPHRVVSKNLLCVPLYFRVKEESENHS